MPTKAKLNEILLVAEDLSREQGKERLAEIIRWLSFRSDHDLDDNDIWQRAINNEEHDYYNWIKSAAEDIVEEAEGDREDSIERIWEIADGSSWVIYTHNAIKVLIVSRNEDHWFESGYGDVGDSFTEMITRLAFAAVVADLGEAVEAALEEYEEEEEEEDA